MSLCNADKIIANAHSKGLLFNYMHIHNSQIVKLHNVVFFYLNYSLHFYENCNEINKYC